MAEKKTNGTSAGAIIAGIAGITAAAVGAYYLYGSKDAEKNRAKVKGWMLKAKGEVLEELENAKEVTEDAYHSAVDAVAKKYQDLKSVDAEELAAFVAEMKGHWQGIKSTLKTSPAVRKAAGKNGAAKKPAAKKGKK